MLCSQCQVLEATQIDQMSEHDTAKRLWAVSERWTRLLQEPSLDDQPTSETSSVHQPV